MRPITTEFMLLPLREDMLFYWLAAIPEIKCKLKLKSRASYLPVSPDGASTVTEELRHVVVADEFP